MSITLKDVLDINRKLLEVLYAADAPQNMRLLVVSRYSERTKVNLTLLKFFLQEMKKKGVFITIDRPHQYIAYLLKLHRVPQEKLTYVDAVSRISGERLRGQSNVKFLNGPYQIGFLNGIVQSGYEAGDVPASEIDLSQVDFVLIDDVAALTKYNDIDSVKRLIMDYMSSIQRLENVTAPIVLDANRDKDLYKAVVNECDRVLLINLGRSLIKVVGGRWNGTAGGNGHSRSSCVSGMALPAAGG